jgi:hypothetical protein
VRSSEHTPLVGEDFSETARSAVNEIEAAVPGVKVRGLSPDELVSASVIAERVGRSREYIRLLANGARGPGDFPDPVGMIDKQTRVWRWSEVSCWFSGIGDQEDKAEEAQVIAAIDAAVRERWHASKIPSPSGRHHLFDVATDLLKRA